MIAVVEKSKENKEEARFLLESAEGFDIIADYFLCWSGKQIQQISKVGQSTLMSLNIPVIFLLSCSMVMMVMAYGTQHIVGFNLLNKIQICMMIVFSSGRVGWH